MPSLETVFPIGKVPRSENDEVLEKEGVGKQNGAPVTHAVFKVVDRGAAARAGLTIETGIEVEHQTGADTKVSIAGRKTRQRSEERPLRIVGAGTGSHESLVFFNFFPIFRCRPLLRCGNYHEKDCRKQGGQQGGSDGRHGHRFLSIDCIRVLVRQ